MAKVDVEKLLKQVATIHDRATINDILSLLLGRMSLVELCAVQSVINEAMHGLCQTPAGTNLCEGCLYEDEDDCIDHPRCLPKRYN